MGFINLLTPVTSLQATEETVEELPLQLKELVPRE